MPQRCVLAHADLAPQRRRRVRFRPAAAQGVALESRPNRVARSPARPAAHAAVARDLRAGRGEARHQPIEPRRPLRLDRDLLVAARCLHFSRARPRHSRGSGARSSAILTYPSWTADCLAGSPRVTRSRTGRPPKSRCVACARLADRSGHRLSHALAARRTRPLVRADGCERRDRRRARPRCSSRAQVCHSCLNPPKTADTTAPRPSRDQGCRAATFPIRFRCPSPRCSPRRRPRNHHSRRFCRQMSCAHLSSRHWARTVSRTSATASDEWSARAARA